MRTTPVTEHYCQQEIGGTGRYELCGKIAHNFIAYSVIEKGKSVLVKLWLCPEHAEWHSRHLEVV
jgi:hypothetical protein